LKQGTPLFVFNEQKNKVEIVEGKVENSISTIEKEFSGEEAEKVIEATSACPTNSFLVKDLDSGEAVVGNNIQTEKVNEIKAVYDDEKEFVMDPKGYFLIRVNYETKEIEVAFCNSLNNVCLKVVGNKPIDIYHVIAVKEKLDLKKEHYAYLGRELEKAFHCIQKNLEYVQDDELHEMKPRE
jgi:ferredoxin